jgi:hypothetical protein
MKKALRVILALSLASAVYAADDVVSAVHGTVEKVDSPGKTIVVKTADGTEKTFMLSAHAVGDSGKEIGKGTEKGTKVVVYSTEDAGKKVAHFFEKV